MSDNLEEVYVVATTTAGTIDMIVEVDVSGVFHQAVELGGTTAGATKAGRLTGPNGAISMAAVTPADITLQIAYDVGGAIWQPASLMVIGCAANGTSKLLAAIPTWPAGVGLTETGQDGTSTVSPGHNYYIVSAQAVINAS